MKIMLPLDGSNTSESALPWVEALAAHMGASIQLVQVVDPFMAGPTGEAPTLAIRLTERRQGDVEKYLQQKVSQIKGLSCEWKCLMGSAPRLLGSLAQPDNCQAVVLASHGRSGGIRWLMGSVAEGVLRQSGVPVLLLRPNSAGQPGPFRKVLVPLDGSSQSQAFLPALQAWLAADAEVLLLRASGFDAHDYINVVDPDAHKNFLQHMDDELNQVALPGVRVSRHALDGDASESILAMAEQHGCDLVAMSTHGRSGWQRFLLGSVTEKVARRAHCPVLAFPQSTVSTAG